MSIHFVKGDMLEANLDYYCHQVNCQGRMGSGIAKAIKEKWPIVYTNYMAKFENIQPEYFKLFLGTIQLVPLYNDYYLDKERKQVINMFAQETYGYDGRRYTSYDAFWSCLGQIKNSIPKGSKIGFPDHIGCGLGGANWEVIRAMIWEVLSEDFDVYIYKLEA